MHIRGVSNQITVSINGETVNLADRNKDATDKRSKYGCFEFQDHGYVVWLKNVRFKDLDNSKWSSLKHQDFEHRVHSFQ